MQVEMGIRIVGDYPSALSPGVRSRVQGTPHLFSNQEKFRYRRNTNDETGSQPSAITPGKGYGAAPSVDGSTPYPYQRKVTQRSGRDDAGPVKGNIADIRDLV